MCFFGLSAGLVLWAGCAAWVVRLVVMTDSYPPGSGGAAWDRFRLGRLMDRTVVSGTIDGGSIPSRAVR